MRGRRDAQTEAGPELDRIPDHSDRKYRDGVETCYPFRFGFLNALLALICIGPPIEHGCPRVGQQQTAHGHHLTPRKGSLGTVWGKEFDLLSARHKSIIVTTLLPECTTTYTSGGENVPGAKFSARVTKTQMDLTTVSTRGLRR